MRAPAPGDVAAGAVLLSVEDVSLAFGGVRALADVSFDIRKGEIRAIIGPNGAGKTSMLNVINGFYQPQKGRIIFKGKARPKMRPYEAAHGGIARTFQNVALFRGMTALDNILTGRSLKMNRGFVWQLVRHGPALAEEVEHRRRVEEIIDFLNTVAVFDFFTHGRTMAQELPEEIAMHLQRAPGHNIVERRHAAEQRDILKRARDAAICRIVRAHLRAGLTLECDAPLLGLIEPVDDIEHRRLAGTVRPDNRANLAFMDIERNVADRFHAAERQRNVFHGQ